MTVSIRIGQKDDLPQTLALIKELAEYERAPLEVSNTIEMMEEDGFGENKIFDFFVAEHENKIVGIAIYYMKYSTWKGKCLFLEDIVITESFRKFGIGSQLFEAVAKVAKELNVERMEWQVLEWNEPAINFYKKYNAILDPEWINGKFTKEQLEKF